MTGEDANEVISSAQQTDSNAKTVHCTEDDPSHQDFMPRKTRRAYTDWEILYGANASSDILNRLRPSITPTNISPCTRRQTHMKTVHFPPTVIQNNSPRPRHVPSEDEPEDVDLLAPASTKRHSFFRPRRIFRSLTELKNKLRNKTDRP